MTDLALVIPDKDADLPVVRSQLDAIVAAREDVWEAAEGAPVGAVDAYRRQADALEEYFRGRDGGPRCCPDMVRIDREALRRTA